MVKIKKNKKINVMISEKMQKDFDEALAKNEDVKSEVIRAFIKKYIKDSK